MSIFPIEKFLSATAKDKLFKYATKLEITTSHDMKKNRVIKLIQEKLKNVTTGVIDTVLFELQDEKREFYPEAHPNIHIAN